MKKQVALIVETSSAYGRDLLSGIIRFMHLRDEWSVFLDQRDLWQEPPAWLDQWDGDGVITRVSTPELSRAVTANGVPMVEVSDRSAETTRPQVRSDDAAIGRLAAEHFIERGFTRFGFCGFVGEAWSERRQVAFRQTVRERLDADCDAFNSIWHGPDAKSWRDERRDLTNWLGSLRPPVAVMAGNDLRGQQVLDACAELGLRVPEEIAVIGVDNDDLLCRVCSPSLSSVIPDAEAVGYRAAEILSRLMAGESAETAAEVNSRQMNGPQIIPPRGIRSRQSTDVVAIAGREIAAALHFIREHACRGISVDEVVENCQVSRSTLERQVRRYLGRTPQEEIRHVQIKRVQDLLRTTDLSVEKIAAMTGFTHAEYLHVVFKRITGLTTGEYRRSPL